MLRNRLGELLQRMPRRTIALVLLFTLVSLVNSTITPSFLGLYPSYAVGVAVVYFCGYLFLPIIFALSLISKALAEASVHTLIVVPLATLLQAGIATYLLKNFAVDPLFRRYRDMLYLMVSIAITACIAPSVEIIVGALSASPVTLSLWIYSFTATVTCLLIGVPFLLRWFTKPRFHRRPLEIVETLIALACVVVGSILLFTFHIDRIGDIPIMYLLFVPLFWIALRLRPRFITLAILGIATIALAGTSTLGSEVAIAQRFFDIETLLIMLAITFFIIVSLEEDRRVSTNTIRSQSALFENAIARVQSESNAKNDFIAILGHELRNPLAPVVSAIDTLRHEALAGNKDTSLIDMMGERMGAVRMLLEDLLDISRITEGKISISRHFIDLRDVIDRAILSTEHYRHELHQSLQYKKPLDAMIVHGDELRLEQVFSNVLTNASKYSYSGSLVRMEISKRDTSVVIEIHDAGIGIDPMHLNKIFEPFQQIEAGERTKKGLGIGLSLVKNFVELHGGSVVAASNGKDQGTTFTIALPLADTPAPVETSHTTASPQPAAAVRKTILIVDDNDAAAAGMGRLLGLEGYHVEYAYSGAQALTKIILAKPDVVLLDIGLPDSDGITIARELRARGFSGVLIALTGYSNPDTKRIAHEAGFDHFVVKPISMAELRALLSA